jgi:hypothetical protein
VGDRVFIWRTQGSAKAVAGVIAEATIVAPAMPRPESADAASFWRHLKVGQVAQDRVLSEPFTPENFSCAGDPIKSQDSARLHLYRVFRAITMSLARGANAPQLAQVAMPVRRIGPVTTRVAGPLDFWRGAGTAQCQTSRRRVTGVDCHFGGKGQSGLLIRHQILQGLHLQNDILRGVSFFPASFCAALSFFPASNCNIPTLVSGTSTTLAD